MTKVTNTQQFVDAASAIYNNAYTYSNTVYAKSNQKVLVTCLIHGDFLITPNAHLQGRGCRLCGIEARARAQTKSTDYFINKAVAVHGTTYSYTNTVYTKSTDKVTITCPIHGDFLQTAKDHISRKAGCPQCARDITNDVVRKRIKTIDDFIEQSNKIHLNKYDYSLISQQQSTHSHVNIICHTHGVFSQRMYSHLQGVGCPGCNESKGERKIRGLLASLNIPFVYQATFNDCINPITGRKLTFDFYLPNSNVLIEYDGQQHFEPINFFDQMDTEEVANAFEQAVLRDTIKNQYAHCRKIPLIRIPYYMCDDDIMAVVQPLIK